MSVKIVSNNPDPIDALLQQAFTTELDRSVDTAMAERINRRISKDQKLRNLLLLAMGAVIVMTGLLLVIPALETLASTFALPAILAAGSLSPAASIAVAAAVLIALWLYALIDDPI